MTVRSRPAQGLGRPGYETRLSGRSKPAWAWKLARWQQAPTATRGIRPHTPNKLPKWYGKWNAWHKAPVKVTVG